MQPLYLTNFLLPRPLGTRESATFLHGFKPYEMRYSSLRIMVLLNAAEYQVVKHGMVVRVQNMGQSLDIGYIHHELIRIGNKLKFGLKLINIMNE